MAILSLKIDPQTHARIKAVCKVRGCNETTFLNEAISTSLMKLDTKAPDSAPTPQNVIAAGGNIRGARIGDINVLSGANFSPVFNFAPKIQTAIGIIANISLKLFPESSPNDLLKVYVLGVLSATAVFGFRLAMLG
jgi:hypothetical protein